VPSVSPTPSTDVRRALKAAVFALSVLLMCPLIVLVWLEKRLGRGDEIFTLFSHVLAFVPGVLGWWLRGAYYFGSLDQCSWQTHIGLGSLFTHRASVVGARVSTGAYCVFGHVQIGDDVMIGSRVSIPSGKRQHMDDEGHLTSATRFDRVSIGSGCWIGEGAILMADIGKRCIVSAGAVVTSDMQSDVIIGGNPARVLRSLVRNDPSIALEKC
jgi:carbonic anhydrase/acetyltransferase-like protein (isoleucine patch superfamily)